MVRARALPHVPSAALEVQAVFHQGIFSGDAELGGHRPPGWCRLSAGHTGKLHGQTLSWEQHVAQVSGPCTPLPGVYRLNVGPWGCTVRPLMLPK